MGRADDAARAARDLADPERTRITGLLGDASAQDEVEAWRAWWLAAKREAAAARLAAEVREAAACEAAAKKRKRRRQPAREEG